MTIATRSTNQWLVPSQSKTDTVYLVKRHAGALSCSCNGFYYRGRCQHVDAVAATLSKPASKDPSAAETASLFMAPRRPRA
jgi:hypothetical protein